MSTSESNMTISFTATLPTPSVNSFIAIFILRIEYGRKICFVISPRMSILVFMLLTFRKGIKRLLQEKQVY